MTNIKILDEKMKAKGINDKVLSDALGISVSTWYRRKLAPNQITIGEAIIITETLNLSMQEASEIFLQ